MKILTDKDYEWIDNNKEWLKKAEKEWCMDIAKTQTDEYLVETFPETEETVVKKLEEYWQEAKELYKRLEYIRNVVDKIQTDPFSKWFFTQAQEYKEGTRLKWLYQAMRRLEKQKVIFEKKKLEKVLSKEYFKTKEEKKRFDLDKMFNRERLLVDIASYDGIALKQDGERHKALCPFHNEKTPSFFIYSTNWYHCFGCGAHGNFIDFLMEKRKYTFREALEEANRFI